MPIVQDVFGEITSGGIIESPFQTIPERELEQSGQTGIIGGYFVVFGQNFTHHVEIVRVSFLLVISVHVFVEHIQKTGIFVAGSTVVDVLDSIQPQSVHTSVYPSFGTVCHGYVRRGRSGLFHRTIVEVGKVVGGKLGMIIP